VLARGRRVRGTSVWANPPPGVASTEGDGHACGGFLARGTRRRPPQTSA
jgi:hypothetical protein